MAKVNVSLHEQLWRTFRMACIEHKTSASKEIARLIAEQLERWQREKVA